MPNIQSLVWFTMTKITSICDSLGVHKDVQTHTLAHICHLLTSHGEAGGIWQVALCAKANVFSKL